MDQYVEAQTFIPSTANNHDAMTTPPQEASPSQPSCRPYRKGPDLFYPAALPSPLKPALRLGCASLSGNMNTNTKQNPGWMALTSPNSFDQLYTEKAYLTASLKNQGDREVDFMRKLSIFQVKIDNGLPSDERRKLRKKTALLKSKIMEATAQKKAILLRLGDIYVELQSRETWMQIQSELCERRDSWWSTDSPSTAYVTTPSDVTSMIPTPLDVTSPAFFPFGCHPIYNTWEATAPYPESQTDAPQNGVLPEFRRENNETLDVRTDDLGNHGLRFEYEVQASLQGANEYLSRPFSGDLRPWKLKRRISLPSMKCVWPTEGEPR